MWNAHSSLLEPNRVKFDEIRRWQTTCQLSNVYENYWHSQFSDFPLFCRCYVAPMQNTEIVDIFCEKNTRTEHMTFLNFSSTSNLLHKCECAPHTRHSFSSCLHMEIRMVFWLVGLRLEHSKTNRKNEIKTHTDLSYYYYYRTFCEIHSRWKREHVRTKFNTRTRQPVSTAHRIVSSNFETELNSNTLTTEITSFPLEINHDNLWRAIIKKR